MNRMMDNYLEFGPDSYRDWNSPIWVALFLDTKRIVLL